MIPKLKLSNCIVLILGSIIQAVGIYNIHAISGVTEGGVLGLTLLLHQWLRISPALSSLALNIFCYALGWKTLGRFSLCFCLELCIQMSISFFSPLLLTSLLFLAVSKAFSGNHFAFFTSFLRGWS